MQCRFFRKNFGLIIWLPAFFAFTPLDTHAAPSKIISVNPILTDPAARQWYVDFFENVYKTMDENYYLPVSRDVYDRFMAQFDQKIFNQLQAHEKADNFVKWKSASMLVDKLKSPEDSFSGLYPPQPAVEFKQSSLGTRIDLGIEGTLIKQGFEITRIEPHADAYAKGLREGHLILEINNKKVRKLKEEKIKDLLNPLADSYVKIKYSGPEDLTEKTVEILSKEYFKQTVFLTPTTVPGIYCFTIKHFNKKTGEDMFRFLSFIKERGLVKGLILDLRNNPGGPPLAAREISSFFMKGGDPFAYFQKRGQPKAWLDVPPLPEEYHFEGPMVILINKDSGSASELFAGILQRQTRAVIMGVNSAGKVLLKSMFDFEDKSMLALVTGRGHHPDGVPFSFQGVTPDHVLSEKDGDMLNYATQFLVFINQKSL